MKARWKNFGSTLLMFLIAVLLTWFIVQPVFENNLGFENKSLWERMELLIVPLVLAFGVYYFNKEERKLEREIAKDRQQEAALQSYLDQMTELLLKEKLRTTENKDVADVAKVRTLSVLRGLDPKRKGMVILFLSEAWLNYIHYGNNPAKIVIDLDGADLSGIDLAGKPLVHAKLTNTNLSMANFQGTIFDGCDLSHSNLTYANLQGCDLAGDIGPGLPTNISYADMSFANLTNALVSDHQLEEVKSLKGATLPNGTKHKERLLKQDRSKAKG